MFYFPPSTLQISHTTLIGHCRLAANRPPPGGASVHGYHTQIFCTRAQHPKFQNLISAFASNNNHQFHIILLHTLSFRSLIPSH